MPSIISLRISKLPAWYAAKLHNKEAVITVSRDFAISLFEDSNGRVDLQSLTEARVF